MGGPPWAAILWFERETLTGIIPKLQADVIFYGCRRGHFGRALEEAVQTHASQWPSAWNSKNPLHGGGNFTKMGPTERVSSSTLRNGLHAFETD